MFCWIYNRGEFHAEIAKFFLQCSMVFRNAKVSKNFDFNLKNFKNQKILEMFLIVNLILALILAKKS